jgi:hydrogenase nickel incorporation protein HypB
VENVGNLVCPALFDLGERAKVLVASVTEGEEKPLKYPHMFRASQLVLLNKVDLLPHVRFDVARFTSNARQVQPGLEVLPVSATTGEGLTAFYAWMRGLRLRG